LIDGEGIIVGRKGSAGEVTRATGRYWPTDVTYFITKDKICKSYDFKIKDKPIIIEVDGDFWHGGPGTTSFWKDVDKVKENDKIKENKADERGIKIIRFWQSELKNNTDIVINRLKEYL